MSEFVIEPQPLVDENPNTDKVFKNVKSIQVGAGNTQFNAGKEGIFLGADNPTDAPFAVDMEGNLKADAGTFGGELSAATGTFEGDISGASGTFAGAVTTDEITDSTYGYSGVFVKSIKTAGSGANGYINIGTDNGGLLNVAVNYTTNSDTEYKLLPSFNVSNGNSYYKVEINGGVYQIYLEKEDIADDISGIDYFYISAFFNSNETNGY